jgi:alpha-1,3-glucosyltransferase
MKGNVVYRVFRHMKSIWGILLLAVIVRVLVGLGGYSGKGDWPQLGDFEAHRNWMSITVNRSLDGWYWEGDSTWWRIDYPPIAAYLSYIFGLIYYSIEPQSLLLQQGYESESLTAYMRFTTLLTDLLFLIPALTLLISHTSPFHKPPTHLFFASVLLVLLKPDIILIDHGHFQYNSVALGLIIYSIYCVLTDRLYLCCVLFTLAINTKQMSAYYCLGFPAVLVGRTLIRYSRQYGKVRLRVLVFGVIVVGVCAVLWIPWLHHPADVLNAIFPLHRGLYQLKVPNWWCATDPLFKWQQRFTN